MMHKITTSLMAALFLLLSPVAGAVTDPLHSPMWHIIQKYMLNDEPIVFDPNVRVLTPEKAEDPMAVPIAIHVDGLENIKKILVFADLNPIQKVIVYKPIKAAPYLAFRIKVEQSTPIRAAVKTADGVWHLGGSWVHAAGGGCTTPGASRLDGSWYETLGQVHGRFWPRENEPGRLRFQVMHPMDTGLASGIPEFFIQHLDITDGQGDLLATLQTYQPLSENPVFSLDIPDLGDATEILISGRDNNGNTIQASVAL